MREWSRFPATTARRSSSRPRYGFSDEELAGRRRFPRSQATPLGEAIQLAVPVFLDDGRRELRLPGSGGRGAPTASVPLRAGDRVLGALGFRFERGHVFDDAQRAFAITLGEQCAYALERARVYDAERRARSALGLLAAIGEQLARSLDPDEALRTLADLVVPTLADQCVVDLVSGESVRRLVVVNADPEVQEAARVMEGHPPALGSDTPVAVAIRTGVPQVVVATEDLPGHGVPQPRAPRGRADGRHPHAAGRADDRARAHDRRAHVRLAEPHAARRRRLRSWRRRSPGASRSRSTTARSTRRRTASASGSRR